MSVDTVRTLIGDPFLYDRAESVGDGVSKEFQLPQFPVKPSSESVSVDDIAQVDSTDYTLDDSLGLVSMVIAPGDGESVVITYQWSLLTDAQIEAMLDLEDDNIKLAAADCLDSIASTQAIIQKKIKSLDLQTDGPALADALRKHAKSLRDQVLSADAQEPDFDIAEQIYNTPGYIEKVIKDFQREGSI